MGKKNYRKKKDSSEEDEPIQVEIKRKRVITQSLEIADSEFKQKKLANKVDFKALKTTTINYDSNTLKELKQEQLYRKTVKVDEVVTVEENFKVKEAIIPDKEAIEQAKKARHKRKI